MKIKISKDSVDFESMKTKLENNFTDYTFKERSKKFLVASKSNTVGCNILMRKNKIIVVGNFPTMTGQIIYSLSLVLLGVLIPLIIYFAVFHKKMKRIENEIGEFIKEECGI